ncbi:hypothetical protein [Fibrella arboris]|uniref:hypothetical protein n=1 Tax=Fibrella arboris TaxID=3242486 RepID=UPI003522A34C
MMRDYFIYKYEDVVSSDNKLKITVLFIHQVEVLSQNALAQELNLFFQENSITDKLVVIIPSYLEERSLEYFRTKREITFARVPGKSADYFDRCLMVYQFDHNGDFSLKYGNRPNNELIFIKHLLRSGSTHIFKNNGGLVESTPDHHFVFPSKKHCSKFIRTGNVLINQAEIFFLAIQLLRSTTDRNIIYCDTSSINVLPYAVFELKRRFGLQFDCPVIHSFESYEVFENSKDSFPPDSLILVSSSTSGNIIDRILDEKRAQKEQIQLIFFLGSEERYRIHNSNIICNLTKDEQFSLGEDEFKTYSSPDTCKLCKDHSRPIHIRGDVFLTIQPRIEKHLLTAKPEHVPKNISSFVGNYRSNSSDEGVIKVYYKDNIPDENYEIYFDMVYLLDNIHCFTKFNESLNRTIDKHIPANTKYLLHLPDVGSENLAQYIISKIPDNIQPEMVKLDRNFIDKITENSGTIVIVASCITTGKKLLQISRLMRSRENLNLVYFIGIYRPVSERFSVDLINDLKKGKDKSDERPFVAVDTIYCSIQQVDTSWEVEKLFFEKLIGSIDDESSEFYSYVDKRLDIIRDNKRRKGFSNDVFLKMPNGDDLTLRKNFAFWNFTYENQTVSQSEVYFTISTIITNLENKQIDAHPSLKQTNYVRNMLSPRNFHRFNDGIIQASLLRSGKTEYFSYDLDRELSLQMKEFLLSIIDKYDTEDGEAILEFILAIGVKKLKLREDDLKEVLNKAMTCSNIIICTLSTYIYSNVLFAE